MPPKKQHTPEPPAKGKKLGYARVSTSDQDERMQVDALEAAGVPRASIYQERRSGASIAKREQLQALLKDVRAGDTVYVWKLDRLARNAFDLYQTAEAIAKKRANLVVLTMPGMDTRTPIGRAMFGMLATFAEFERAIALERTMAGLKAARERGRFGGRREKITETQVHEARRRIEGGEELADIAAEYGVTRQALYRRVNLQMEAESEQQ